MSQYCLLPYVQVDVFFSVMVKGSGLPPFFHSSSLVWCLSSWAKMAVGTPAITFIFKVVDG